jgi:hypothetical protein
VKSDAAKEPIAFSLDRVLQVGGLSFRQRVPFFEEE